MTFIINAYNGWLSVTACQISEHGCATTQSAHWSSVGGLTQANRRYIRVEHRFFPFIWVDLSSFDFAFPLPVSQMHPALISDTFLSSLSQLLHDLCLFLVALVTRLSLYLCSYIFKRSSHLSILPTHSAPTTPHTESPNAFDSVLGTRIISSSFLYIAYMEYLVHSSDAS